MKNISNYHFKIPKTPCRPPLFRGRINRGMQSRTVATVHSFCTSSVRGRPAETGIKKRTDFQFHMEIIVIYIDFVNENVVGPAFRMVLFFLLFFFKSLFSTAVTPIHE